MSVRVTDQIGRRPRTAINFETIRVGTPPPPAFFDDHPGAVAGYQLGTADLLSRHGGAVAGYRLGRPDLLSQHGGAVAAYILRL